jgi:hypothetical protein
MVPLRQPRMKGILPVRISGVDRQGKPFDEHVCTAEISRSGASLAGVAARLAVGDVAGLQYRNREAQFRVTWITPDGAAPRIGIEFLQPNTHFWPVTPVAASDQSPASEPPGAGDRLAGVRATRRSAAGRARAAKESASGKAGEATKVERKRYLLVWSAVAIAAVVALAALLSMGGYQPAGGSQPPSAAATAVPRPTETLPPQLAYHIRNLAGWRIADTSDFDADAREWLRQHAQTASGRLSGNFSGASDGQNGDAAYLLTKGDGSFRLIMLIGNEIACDVNYNHIEVAAVVRKPQVASANWVDGRTRTPDGDGLLIVLGKHDPASGLILFMQGGVLRSARPVDYRSLNLG